MDTNSPEFVSLLAAATWWRDYAMRLREGREGYPSQPYPTLYPFTPYPPSGVGPKTREQPSTTETTNCTARDQREVLVVLGTSDGDYFVTQNAYGPTGVILGSDFARSFIGTFVETSRKLSATTMEFTIDEGTANAEDGDAPQIRRWSERPWALEVDSHEVPYVTVRQYDDGHFGLHVDRPGCGPVFGLDADTEDEVLRWAPLLANAMAVAAGRTSHGENSRPLNPHVAMLVNSELVYIARCPEHGLHGQRDQCFVCGGPVEHVEMVDVKTALAIVALGLAAFGDVGAAVGEAIPEATWDDLTERGMVQHGRDFTGEGTCDVTTAPDPDPG